MSEAKKKQTTTPHKSKRLIPRPISIAPPHDGSERRGGERIALRFLLPYRHPERPEELLSGTTRDINAAGLLFATPVKIDVGEILHIFLDHLPGGRKYRPLLAQTMRTEIDERSDNYLVGVKFLDLDPEAKKEIESALELTDIMTMLRQVAKAGASDLHLAADHPPLLRRQGELRPLREEALAALDVRDMIYTLLDTQHRRVFERDLELNFSLSVAPQWRFRVNVHSQRGNVEASFRQIEPLVRNLAELNLPPALTDLANLRDGLVLITGPAGSGKTTAAAAMIEYINANRAAVIITMENPIEYLYTYRKSVIKQREIGLDTRSYAAALREAMRQDPDVILIGEVRDEETMQAAIEAAQTGHLVIATFSSASCIHAIIRLYQFFRRGNQSEIQVQLANCLRGIVALRLLPRIDQPGLIPAAEVLISTPAITNMIRMGSTPQIKSAIQTGGSFGMNSFENSLEKLRRDGIISAESCKLTLGSL